MAISEKLEAAYHQQIQLEFQSWYVYLGMAVWCEARELTGFARWMRSQAEEENAHAMRFVDFVLQRDGAVELLPLAAPEVHFASPLDVMEQALAHEQKVTAAIGELYDRALDDRDHTSMPLLQWFLSEQVEEEASVRQIVAELRMIGQDEAALLLLDRDLPGRRAAEGADGVQ